MATSNPTTVIDMRSGEPCDVRIDRTTPFGNPFRIGVDGSRDEVIRLYRDYFNEWIQDPENKNAIDEMNLLVLGCWCAPRPCHGDVIVEYLDG